jgi:hypothetical protein
MECQDQDFTGEHYRLHFSTKTAPLLDDNHSTPCK